ncbi:hypothetical protein HYW21_03815 [Candidatus Woesearchaeota archaeon]|nr:hypothetical protein [Candidatus Woesearchaeota archaeon]
MAAAEQAQVKAKRTSKWYCSLKGLLRTQNATVPVFLGDQSKKIAKLLDTKLDCSEQKAIFLPRTLLVLIS